MSDALTIGGTDYCGNWTWEEVEPRPYVAKSIKARVCCDVPMAVGTVVTVCEEDYYVASVKRYTERLHAILWQVVPTAVAPFGSGKTITIVRHKEVHGELAGVTEEEMVASTDAVFSAEQPADEVLQTIRVTSNLISVYVGLHVADSIRSNWFVKEGSKLYAVERVLDLGRFDRLPRILCVESGALQ